jgi:hypothetical protein
MDAITAEALARTTADGLKTQLFLNTDAITAEANQSRCNNSKL